MSTKSSLILAAALAMSASLAHAHAHVVSAKPAVNGQAAGSPKEVRIKFNEAPTVAFSQVTVTGPNGKAVKTGKPAANPSDKTELVVGVGETLAPGAYKVEWKTSGADTHKVGGSYTFTVK